MRVEAELVSGTVHEAAREDPVERHLGTERSPEQRLVAPTSAGETRGAERRVARSTAASTAGGGAKHARGTRRTRSSSYHAPT